MGRRGQPSSHIEGETPNTPVNLRRLLAYARPYVPHLIVALFALVITTSIELAFPYVIKTLLDSVLTQGDLNLLNQIALTLVAIFVLRFFAAYIQQYLLAFIGERVVLDIRNQVYAHLHNLSLRFFSERRVGELVSRLASDATLIRSVLTTNVATVIGQGLTFIGAVAIVVLLNWRMTLFILALAPPVGLITAIFGRRLRRISTAVQDRLAESSTIVDEALQGVRVVKSFAREGYEVNRYKGAMQETFEAAMRLTRVRAAFVPLMYTLSFVAIAGVLWYGGTEVIAKRLTAGGLASFLFYLIFIAASVGAFTGLYTQIQEALGATRRIFEILDTQPDVQDRPGAVPIPRVEGEIVFENVAFSYDERIAVLHGIDLRVAPGEILALVGPSGAGKSTVFNLIPRFYDPTSGHVLIDGHDLRDVTQNSLRAQIGIVPQETLLFGGTIRENILYGRLNAADDEIVEAARAANAHDFIMEFPDGYETVVGERGVKLSGGQRQRVAIARAILKDPRILLLDEATSSLDSESEGLVQEALERLMKNRTTVIIAHRLSTVHVANRIAVLEAGRLVEIGSHADLMAGSGLYARLYNMQFQTDVVGA
jgi:subfamily B ATP-binding cassette protein MsbA